ncbi:cytochrome c oxidase subunit 5b-1, mitochondrial isoform X2 [Arabidopsis lyrata subsp. lyrata]|uniref:cytochrome c oxidase subunit 5b-1, mitochondrial isoform X2 n=1 Tax=Arabidopsis lyrata subsp. lyrata TaxID=81972 RepID=UPI000A29C622|nr:cytochrome c oxidase subunit 5b-1, mitochondrial isoform X2 [Arabidopsis lyrata subsp. lyrata]|eukprot:XP_020870276.1 cytochrome c oxidase subunit 5b-1, mitochondrial isoform X2 [Arabidopsis lyrata subsp. lyrata]
MWRRIVSSNLKSLATASDFAVASSSRRFVVSKPVGLHLSTNRSTISASSSLLSRHFSSESGTSVKKNVEDVMPIATGHEREELEAELEGRRLLDIDYPEGPFGTKESPAVVKSYYDKRIVGCPGGEGEDEHDVVWFWLEKGKSFECPVCSQYFELEVVGPGGPPDGHGDDEDHHH